MAVRELGEDTPPNLNPRMRRTRRGSNSTSTISPHETLPSFNDITSQRVGITVGIRQLKRTRIETRPSTDLPQ
jgi:hypothetical protein